MRIGLQIPSFTWPEGTEGIGPKLAQIGRTADEAGFASLWVIDHFFQIRAVGSAEEPMLEGYSALSYLAEAGIDHLILNMPNVHELRPLETFGEEIIPAVAALLRPATRRPAGRTPPGPRILPTSCGARGGFPRSSCRSS